MKKIFYIVLLIAIFIMGLNIGTKGTINKNQLIDNAKDKFEEEISTPNNEYQAVNDNYEKNLFNKSADTIDKIIQKIIQKLQ